MSVIGFDFGTTNSLVSVVRGEQAINFLGPDGLPIPSVVCYEGAKTIVGREAKDRLATAGLGIQGNIVPSPKTLLGRDSVFVEHVERSPVDIAADVIRHVVQQATSSARGRGIDDMSRAVVTIPVDMQGYRRRALRDAFLAAGINIVQFVHEPLAALYGCFRESLEAMQRRYDRKLILVVDWGGGTLDLTLCRPLDGMVVQIANDGTDEVGGDVFDETIMNELLRTKSSQMVAEPEADAQSGARQRLRDRCERAKIDLSSRERASVYVANYFRDRPDVDFDVTLDRDELERIVKPSLDKGFRRVEALLDRAGYSASQVALCVATGGLSNMPAVRQRLHELFGPERVHARGGSGTLIAEGAAWVAADDARLQLAKNVELGLARNSYLPLVKAGTIMPVEGQVQRQPFHLYCTDPRDGIAKFQICTPHRAGRDIRPNEPREHLENLTVRVDGKARAFEERLELDVSIDQDLILTAHARSLNARDQDQREIHNLEFGLALPVAEPGARQGSNGAAEGRTCVNGHTAGGLSVRANISNTADLRLVPGEFLYQYDHDYFDRRRDPPEEQVRERLFYEPCAICGRASNDPLCKCSELIATPHQ